MSLIEVYETVQGAWIEGRLENVLQRQKELARLHTFLKDLRGDLIAAFSEDSEPSQARASEEIALTLDAVEQLYNQLDFPSIMGKEKNAQASHSAPLNSVAMGPVLIQAALPCPLSSAILPLAAAVAAGSCCLVLLCTDSPAVSRLLQSIIRGSMDYEAVGVLNDILSPKDLGSLQFESAVFQDHTTGAEFAAVLRKTNLTARIHTPALGLPAMFIDRSTPALESVATLIKISILNPPIQHSGRVPRLCFVDEFIIGEFNFLMQKHPDAPKKLRASTTGPMKAKEIARNLKSLFPSFTDNIDELPQIITLQGSDPINPETIGQVASLLTHSYEGVLLVPVRSLDHGIDLWNKVNTGMSAAATYIFGQDKEAWYLARFLKSDHCFINYIPLRSFAMIAPSSRYDDFTLPYSPEDFSINKAILRDNKMTSRRGLLNLKRIAQPSGARRSYFEQGLIVGLSMATLAASGLVFAVFEGVKGIYQ
ncbi:uncharacterized protein N7469_002105 [Penicillium citrinum]|uniref:Aldehyde dehydrogenase domain-containing protein n=1 Tax=Penicillium citrinum TaxID=5077 RepID=A0A9W9P9N6_PENCI|nr:uncharacterized protein N7469_002105 [Penicillium citrinum]KAJ5240514.1 hypothetical protein N7469_002105 [Penicillium citrinum]